MTDDDISAGAPDRIWAWQHADPWGNELRWFEWENHKPEDGDTEYIRADMHTAQIAALEAQLADGSFYKETDIDAMQDRIRALEEALTNFKEFYPMGINPYLDDAYRQALKLLAKDKP